MRFACFGTTGTRPSEFRWSSSFQGIAPSPKGGDRLIVEPVRKAGLLGASSAMGASGRGIPRDRRRARAGGGRLRLMFVLRHEHHQRSREKSARPSRGASRRGRRRRHRDERDRRGRAEIRLPQAGSARLTERVEAVLREIEVLSLKPEASARYGEIRRDLEARGMPIGHNDLWIAAQALSAEAVLVTGNEGEFRRVAGLVVENWLQRCGGRAAPLRPRPRATTSAPHAARRTGLGFQPPDRQPDAPRGGRGRDVGGALFEPVIRLGVTGLSRAGKTVFITSLVANLLDRGRMPQLRAEAEGRILAAYLQPQPDHTIPRFAYEDHLAALTGPDPHWPESTRSISTLRLSLRVAPTGLIGGLDRPARRAPRHRRLPRRVAARPAADEPDLRGLVDRRHRDRPHPGRAPHCRAPGSPGSRPTDAVRAARRERPPAASPPPSPPISPPPAPPASPASRPGRFLMPGDLEGSPALTFSPLPKPDRRPAGLALARLPAALRGLQARRRRAVLPQPLRPPRPPGRADRRARRHPRRPARGRGPARRDGRDPRLLPPRPALLARADPRPAHRPHPLRRHQGRPPAPFAARQARRHRRGAGPATPAPAPSSPAPRPGRCRSPACAPPSSRPSSATAARSTWCAAGSSTPARRPRSSPATCPTTRRAILAPARQGAGRLDRRRLPRHPLRAAAAERSPRRGPAAHPPRPRRRVPDRRPPVTSRSPTTPSSSPPTSSAPRPPPPPTPRRRPTRLPQGEAMQQVTRLAARRRRGGAVLDRRRQPAHARRLGRRLRLPDARSSPATRSSAWSRWP